MTRSTGRLAAVPDGRLVAGWWEGTASKTLEGPAATLLGGGQGGCDAKTRDLPTPHRFHSNEGVDMTKSTRGVPRSDSETRTSAVKITPVSSVSATVPTTHTVA